MTTTTPFIRNLNVAEAAAQMRVSDETLRRAIRAGAPHDRIGVGGRAPIRVSADELRVWFATRREAARVTLEEQRAKDLVRWAEFERFVAGDERGES